MSFAILIFVCHSILKILATNQMESTEIDWNNIWQFQEGLPNKVEFSRLPLMRINEEIYGSRIIGGSEIL